MSDLPRFCLSSWVWVSVLISFDPPTGLSTEQASVLLLTLVLSVIQEIAEGFPDGAVVKSLLPMQETPETRVCFLGQEDPLEQEMATRSNILA